MLAYGVRVGLFAGRKTTAPPPEGALLLSWSASQPLAADQAGVKRRHLQGFLWGRLATLVRATEGTTLAKTGAAPKEALLSLDAPQRPLALGTPGRLDRDPDAVLLDGAA